MSIICPSCESVDTLEWSCVDCDACYDFYEQSFNTLCTLVCSRCRPFTEISTEKKSRCVNRDISTKCAFCEKNTDEDFEMPICNNHYVQDKCDICDGLYYPNDIYYDSCLHTEEKLFETDLKDIGLDYVHGQTCVDCHEKNKGGNCYNCVKIIARNTRGSDPEIIRIKLKKMEADDELVERAFVECKTKSRFKAKYYAIKSEET